VNELVKQFDMMAGMMKDLAGKGMMEKFRAMQDLQKGGMFSPGAKFAKPKQGTGKRLTAEERRKLKKQREREARKKKRGVRGSGAE
jgi:signal recognition particle subunit SRP54